MDKGERASGFLTRLLGRRKRRLSILYRWNCKCAPCKGDTLNEVVHAFIQLLLYKPLRWEMTQDALYPWGLLEPGVSISYTWLNNEERCTVRWVHACRAALFRRENRHPKVRTQFTLSEYMHPLTLSVQHRRELVRDFLGLCCVQPNLELQRRLYYALLVSTHRMLHSPGCVDGFLMGMTRFLNGWCALDDLLVMDLTGE